MSLMRRVANAVVPPLVSSAKRLAGAVGYSLTRRDYYSPIPDAADFSPGFWEEESELVGIDLDEPAALALQATLAPYFAELRARFPLEAPADRKGFWLVNGVYMAGDAHLYYGLVRQLTPRRIIEIGSGQSTLLAVAAAETNRERGATPCQITAIEPYPMRNMQEALGRITLIEKPLQAVDRALFATLERGDILFIDSTHVLREGNDVQLEYLEILPRLAPGVLVHVHDIALPRRYPRTYFEQSLYWNEQYLLQAFLAFNARFEVVWPGNALMLHHPDAMLAAFPEIEAMRRTYPLAGPSAFWMRVRG